MLRIFALIAALLAPSLAQAQQVPPLGYHTVFGRMGAAPGDTGPGQAIPFANLAAQLFGGAVNANTVFAGPASGGPATPAFRTLASGDVPWSIVTATPTTLAGYGITNARTLLTGNVNYYVNGNSGGTATCGPAGANTCAAGSDSNNCLTPATACLTLQHVFNLANTVDFAGQYTGFVYLAHNTGTPHYALICTAGPWIGTSTLTVIGDSTNATGSLTVITDPAGLYGLQVKDGCTMTYQYVAFADAATNDAAGHVQSGVGNYGHVDLGNSSLGPLTIGNMVSASYSSSISLIGPLTVTGGANSAFGVSGGGVIDFGSQTVTVTGTPAFATAFAVLQNGGVMNVNGSNFSGSATGPKCFISGSLELAGFDPNVVFPGSSNCTANNLVQSVNVTSGVLLNGTNAFALTATQPTSPVAAAIAVNWNITSAGSASQTNVGMLMLYGAGYTGSSGTAGFSVANSAAGTGGTLPSAGSNSVIGNTGGIYNSNPTTTGFNFGLAGEASNGNVNFGSVGIAQVAKNSAKNIGLGGYAINTGTSPVEIGLLGSLNPNVIPATSAAGIFDNGAQTVPIALFQANGSTVASVNQTGGLTATLTNVASTSAVCYNTGSGLLTYDGTIGTCNTSTMRVKHDIRPLANISLLDGVLRMKPVSFYYNADQHTDGQQLGLIAEDLAAIDPRLVAYDDKGQPNAIRFLGPMFSYVIGAIKELQASNDNLRGDITQLRRATR